MDRGFVETGDHAGVSEAGRITSGSYGIEVAESRMLTLLTSLPHILTAEFGVAPTHRPPVSVVQFSWPDLREYATGVSEVGYQYFVDDYYPLDNARVAQRMIREDMLALARAIQADDTLGQSCEKVELRDGGRPLFNTQIKQVVKSFQLTIKVEE